MSTSRSDFWPLRPVGLCALLAAVACETDVEPPLDNASPLDSGAQAQHEGGVAARLDATALAWPNAMRVDTGQPVASFGDGGAGARPDAEVDASLAAPSDGGTIDAAKPAPSVMPGAPLEGTRGDWVYTEFPDAHCRDGSPAGVAVSLGDSPQKVMIYLEGGGQCTDVETCAANPYHARDLVLLLGWFLGADGVFDRSNPENPVRDWNFVYVPYCTGDRHAGANPAGNVPDVGPQQFVGYRNMQTFLNRIVPTFPDATEVLLTGISAGGFGVTNTSILVQRAFPNLRVKTINDSGPMLPSSVYAECWQERHRLLWKLDDTYLGECGAACPNKNDHALDFAEFLAESFADRPSGIISSTGDAVERSFHAIGNDNCTGKLSFLFLDPGMSVETFREGIFAYRDRIEPYPNFSTFLLETEEHTFLADDVFYTTSSAGVRLVDWFAKIVRGESPGHVGP